MLILPNIRDFMNDNETSSINLNEFSRIYGRQFKMKQGVNVLICYVLMIQCAGARHWTEILAHQ